MAVKDNLATLFSRPSLTPSLQVTRFELGIPGLPLPLDGFTLAHVSDLHVGPGDWVPVRAREAAAVIVREHPDVVINTGDFLQAIPPLHAVREYAEPLVLGSDPALQGATNLAVLGNHDYYAGEEAVAALRSMLCSLGVRVLANETVSVHKEDAAISFTGLEEREPGFDAAVATLPNRQRPHIVLVHNADVAQRFAPGVADLVLAGHTHGGQITLPGLTGLVVRRFNGSKYVQGWYRINDNPVYINRGLGCTGLPIRFRARPEVTFFRLRR